MRQHSRVIIPAATAGKAESRQPHPFFLLPTGRLAGLQPEESKRACVCAVGEPLFDNRLTTTGAVSWLPGASSNALHRVATATQCHLILAYPQASAPQRRRPGTLSVSAPSCSSSWASSRLLTRLLSVRCPLGPAPSSIQGYGNRTHTNAQAQAPLQSSQRPEIACGSTAELLCQRAIRDGIVVHIGVPCTLVCLDRTLGIKSGPCTRPSAKW